MCVTLLRGRCKGNGGDVLTFLSFLLFFLVFFLGGLGEMQKGGPTMTGYVGLGQDMVMY